MPWAWFDALGDRIKVLDAEVANLTGNPGEVLDDSMTVAAGSAAIRPLKVQRAGRSAMTPQELLRGFELPKGTFLQ